MSDHHDGHDSGGHAVPHKMLIITCVALLLLTVVTVWASSLDFDTLQMPGINVFLAMAIATVKVLIVALIFMHLRWDRSFTGLLFVSSIFFVALFISFAITDTKEYQPEVIQTDSEEVQQKVNELDHSLDGSGGHGHGHGHGGSEH
ncbi:MAG: cytochrome C oxidase subunit IV family protein [Phycisphaerales bacterium]|nr:cytochrome C oxidase subunit IV family protein [Phycisphaerales bacterium]